MVILGMTVLVLRCWGLRVIGSGYGGFGVLFRMFGALHFLYGGARGRRHLDSF